VPGAFLGPEHGHTVDDTPLGLAAANVLAVNNNGLLRADDCERNEVLVHVSDASRVLILQQSVP